jgi:hypothetical protein
MRYASCLNLGRIVHQEEENDGRHHLREPLELTASELDQVAGGGDGLINVEDNTIIVVVNF